MFSPVRRYLKTAILFLGLGLGGWMMVRRKLLGIHHTAPEVSGTRT